MPIKHFPSIFGIRPAQFSHMFGDLDAFSPMLADRMTAGGIYPKMDVEVTQETVEISIELPGVKPEAVEIRAVDNTLVIYGEKSAEEKHEDNKAKFVERSYGRFERTVPLNFKFSPDDIEAKFEDGVLRVTVARVANTEPDSHIIQIKGTS